MYNTIENSENAITAQSSVIKIRDIRTGLDAGDVLLFCPAGLFTMMGHLF
jgi:hypothetical protein